MTASIPSLPLPPDPASTAALSGMNAVQGPQPASPSAPPAGTTPVSADAAFSALLLSLRAPVAGPAAATTVASNNAQLNPDTPGFAPPFALTNLQADAADTEAGSGSNAGEFLPVSGTELPPTAADIESLLASLALPASPGTRSVSASVPDPTTPMPGTAPEVTAGSAATVNQASSPLATSVRAGESAAPAAAPIGSVDETVLAAWQETGGSPAETLSVIDNAGASADGRDAPTSRGMELALPAEFRARLDALLNATQRPSLTANGDVSALAAPVMGPSAATSATMGSATPVDTLFDTLPVLEPLGDRQAFTQNLGDRLLMMADKGLQSATLKLHPEHLGPMEIRIRVDDDGAAQVLFSAHHQQTREALEGTIPRLRELFADQGLNLAQANVDSGRSAFAQREFATSLPPWRNRESDAPENMGLVETAWRLRPGTERRLDVLV